MYIRIYGIKGMMYAYHLQHRSTDWRRLATCPVLGRVMIPVFPGPESVCVGL